MTALDVGDLPILINYNFVKIIPPSLPMGRGIAGAKVGRKALYLFAGKARRSDVGDCLRQRGWDVLELDILRDKSHDISLEKVQDKIRGWIRERTFRALLASPPCDSFTRAKMANLLGPRPVRDFDHQRGLPGLSWKNRRIVNLANDMVDFTFELFQLHFAWESAVGVLEHPEDLGTVTHGPFYGCRPAAIWQFPAFFILLALPGVITVGLRQCDFGTEYVKPTRLVLKLFGGLSPLFFPGLPELDSEGFYNGPIPKAEGLRSLAKKKGEIGFRTSGTAAWPPQLCDLLASSLSTLPTDGDFCAVDSNLGDPVDPPSKSDPEDGAPTVVPPSGYWIGGKGKVRTFNLLGKDHLFNDGAGLTSPGRWDKAQRVFPTGARWTQLRNALKQVLLDDLDDLGVIKQFAGLATGKDSLFDFSWPVKMRSILHQWLQKQIGNYTTETTPSFDERQPFFLDLMFYVAREMLDPDFEVLKELRAGVSAGILEQLPRVPAVFEEQTKWRLTEDPLDGGAEFNSNYKSVDEFREAVREQVQADQLEGRMMEFSEEDFRAEFGGNVAISALAVLQERDKIRVLHDGTHVTKVNHRIKVRCKLRMPTAKEKFYLLDLFRSGSKIGFRYWATWGKHTA